jgi:2-dehydro-3-deoxyphosphogluconate aldolase/(4S)-4-hydroxy-2-oxoglutarate aldolase
MDGSQADVIRRIGDLGLVPVVQIPTSEQALPLAEALLEGGLPCAEITFRTEAAAESLALIRERCPEMLLGAGTVLSTLQVDAALDAGAEFIVSPGTNPAVVSHCRSRGAVVIPGICTPTEIELALSHGIDVVKFFPAEAMGGVGALKAFSGPYPQVRYIPTGGIEGSNLRSYLRLSQVLACAGSWMVKPELLARGEWATVVQLVREAVDLVREMREPGSRAEVK